MLKMNSTGSNTQLSSSDRGLPHALKNVNRHPKSKFMLITQLFLQWRCIVDIQVTTTQSHEFKN